MKKAVFTFENVITDDAKTVLAVDLIELVNPDNNAIIRYLFEGIYSTKNRSIQYSGFIERLLLVLNLKEE
jgi:hypothetical protein